MYRHTLILTAIATPLFAGAQVNASATVQDTLHPVSLPEAVSLAQRNAPAAVQARGQLRTAASAVRLAYGAFVPSLSVSMNQTQQSGQRFDVLRNQVVSVTQPWSYSTGVSSSLELFDGGFPALKGPDDRAPNHAIVPGDKNAGVVPIRHMEKRKS